MAPLHIFKPGTHTAASGQTLTFSAADLDATARAYDPAQHQAPLVVGHPALDQPAYGWVKALTFQEGALLAEPDQLDPAFAELVQAGRFKKLSAAFFTPTAPSNPVPGVYYLRHVGFLGAAAPAVKGLRTPTFAEADAADLLTLEFTQPEPEPPMSETPAVYAAREAALAQRETDLVARETALRTEQAALRRALDAAFAEHLVKQGRLLPRDQAGLATVLSALTDLAPLEFAEEGAVVNRTPRAWIEAFLQRLPVQVDFSERSAAPPGSAVAFADPDALAHAAQQYQHAQAQAGTPVSMAEAVAHVLKGAA